ncbi:hypothetical protein MHYP_G00190720 [Metynnis hypsauchen]
MQASYWLRGASVTLTLPILFSTDLLTQIHEAAATPGGKTQRRNTETLPHNFNGSFIFFADETLTACCHSYATFYTTDYLSEPGVIKGPQGTKSPPGTLNRHPCHP